MIKRNTGVLSIKKYLKILFILQNNMKKMFFMKIKLSLIISGFKRNLFVALTLYQPLTPYRIISFLIEANQIQGSCDG